MSKYFTNCFLIFVLLGMASSAYAMKRKCTSNGNYDAHVVFRNTINSVLKGFPQKTWKEDIKRCLKQGVNIDYPIDLAGSTALSFAVETCQEDLFKFLIAKGAHVNVADMYGFTPLHNHINKLRNSKKFDISIFKELLKHGANFHAKTDVTKETPLSWLAQFGTAELMELAIEHGANINEKDVAGCTPLAQAIFHKKYDLLELLPSYGASLTNIDNFTGGSALHLALGFSIKYIENIMIGATVTSYHKQQDEQLKKSMKTILCVFNRVGFPKEVQHKILLELSSDCLHGFNAKLLKGLITFDHKHLLFLVDKRMQYLAAVVTKVNKQKQTATELLQVEYSSYKDYVQDLGSLLGVDQLTKNMEAFRLAFPDKVKELDQKNLALKICNTIKEKIGIE